MTPRKAHTVLLAAAAAALLIMASAAAPPAHAQVTPLCHDRGGVGLGLALRHLGVDGGLLYVTAHPDDEDNGALVKYQRGLGISTSLLTVTRGDGGQNEIGPELFQAIGILRTEELAGVHRYDGADQYFTRAFEFGYSFSVEETFEKWGHEEILRDVVRVIRTVRPDVILTMHREGPGGGQHHQTTARLAHEAFRAAADPTRFPEQIEEGLRPWQAGKVYQSAGGRPGAVPEGGVIVDASAYDPLLGMSWDQFGSLARAAHRCQGMGQLHGRPGGSGRAYELVDSEPEVEAAESDIFEGVDTSLSRWLDLVKGQEAQFLEAGIESIEESAKGAREAFDVQAAHKTLAPLAAGLSAVRDLREKVKTSGLSAEARDEILFRLKREEKDFARALGLAQGLDFQVTVDDGDVVRGQAFTVTAEIWNQSPEPVSIDDVALHTPEGWTVELKDGQPGDLEGGEGITLTYVVTVGNDARYSQPYWKRNLTVDRYDIEIPEHHTLPWSPPRVVGKARYTTAGVPAALKCPAYFRYDGPWVGGQKEKVVNVVPALSVELTPGIAVVPLSTARTQHEFRVKVLSNAKQAAPASVRLEAPESWSVEPAEVPLSFQAEGEELTARFLVTPPAGIEEGDFELQAVATRGRQEFREGYQVIAYDHTQERHLFHPAASQVKTLDVTINADASVGYVMGAGDEVPAAIEMLGYDLTFLTPDDLAFGDLSKYSTIVTGIRAYQTRKDLKAHHQRLMEYAKAGGHLVVQYNKYEFNQLAERPQRSAFGSPQADVVSPYAPYPAAVTSNRITVEEAPIKILEPEHAILKTPNKITARDFDGWVQERGLYFLGAQDPSYKELLSSTEPWPKNPGEKKGMLVTAPVGKGSWTYVGLGLWRQLPAGTRGAYRILSNLLGRPRAE